MKKGFSLIELMVVVIIVIILLCLVVKAGWYMAIGPIFRNIIPLLIGGFVGYVVGKKNR